MKQVFILAITLLPTVIFAQKGDHTIAIPFAEATTPPAPDYSDTSNWCSLPNKVDPSDLVPKGEHLKNRQADAQVDVFFVHPTTFLEGPQWNADLSNTDLNDMTDRLPIKYQSTVFNGSGRIYAPRYRQAHIRAFYNYNDGGKEALEIAYQDVKRAFQYYLDHYNDGRPFIIASHSQGTFHAERLIRELIDGTPLQDQMVAAYLVGMPIKDTTFQHIPVCDNPGETGCFVSWGTYAEGYYPPDYDQWIKGAIIVNPVSWQTDTTWVNHKNNLGFVGRNFKVRKHVWDTKVHASMLWVGKPHMPLGKLLARDNFHIADYNLFWVDVRKNVALRVQNYLNTVQARNNK